MDIAHFVSLGGRRSAGQHQGAVHPRDEHQGRDGGGGRAEEHVQDERH